MRSIRFMRMLLAGFDQSVVMRFGTLDLVRGDWRRYNRSLNEAVLANANTTVDISTVNILENENRIPVNYILPPEIQRGKSTITIPLFVKTNSPFLLESVTFSLWILVEFLKELMLI